MSVRKQVAAQLREDNPSFIVKDYPASPPDNIANGKVWVNVYRESFTAADNNGSITHNLKVLVLCSKQGTAEAEDELDAAIDAVMLTLEGFTDVYWQEATRTIVADKYDAFEIGLTAIRPQTYKTQILSA